jgi:EAL domain-containing protein (putative c-di-GMP-specific phosphodiesterase class I)
MKKYQLDFIVPHYQPIVRLSDRKIVMYECLARFIDNNGNGVGPLDLEHLFEDKSFLWNLFDQSFPSIIANAHKDITISVNIDVSSLTPKFFTLIENLAHMHSDITKNIHFEITEKNILKGLSALPELVQHLRHIGYKAVLDDFGTGGANLECLERIKFDLIKIDGQFLIGASTSKEGLKRLENIVGLLKCYGTELVAEHIENETIAKIAQDLNICYGQGHFFGVPAPVII